MSATDGRTRIGRGVQNMKKAIPFIKANWKRILGAAWVCWATYMLIQIKGETDWGASSSQVSSIESDVSSMKRELCSIESNVSSM